MATQQQVTQLRTSINNRAHAMRTQRLGSTAWRQAYDNLLTALRQAQTIIRAGRGSVPTTVWSQFTTTANRQAESALAERQLVEAGADQRPSEGGMTLAQIRAHEEEFAARQGSTVGAERGTAERPWTFAPSEADVVEPTAADIAWARAQQATQPSRVATTPSTTSTTPSTTTTKTAPTPAQIAEIQRQYPGASTTEAARIAQAGMVPSGTLAAIRNWLNPTSQPLYLRPWFLATGATALALTVYFGYQALVPETPLRVREREEEY